MAETIQSRTDAAPQRFPVTGGQIVAAIYRIAFSGRADNDVFANAAVRWTDFIAPVLVFLALHMVIEISDDADLRRAASSPAAVLVCAILVAGILFSLLVAVAVTWGLARVFASPARVVPGLLGYMWMEAALISPWIMIVRSGISGYAPVWLVIFGGFVPFLFLFFGASRVMSVAFGLSHFGFGFLFAVAGSVVAYFVAYLIP
jgi:hypothetical protein